MSRRASSAASFRFPAAVGWTAAVPGTGRRPAGTGCPGERTDPHPAASAGTIAAAATMAIFMSMRRAHVPPGSGRQNSAAAVLLTETYDHDEQHT
jgi:hypothetical protein